MLETEISKLTDQVIRLNELLAALLSSKSDAPAAPVVSVSDAALVSAAVKLESALAPAPVAPAPVAPAPVESAPAPAPVAPAPAPALAPAPVQTEPAAAITLESLRQLCVAKAKKDYANSGRIRGILAPYSVANIQSLKPEDYSAVYAAVEAL